MQAYLDLGQKIINEGKWVINPRTGVRCLTIINHSLDYNVGAGEFPLATTRKVPYKSAIAELIGYIRGYDNAAQFRALGTKTWDANANENKAWLANPNRKGTDDMGKVYGAVARNWPDSDYANPSIDLIQKVYNNLKNGIDDRGETITFWNPGEFNLGCLRPCLYEHQFSILDGVLHLTSTQRSVDFCLGLRFNMVQCYVLLALMAQITGLKPGIARHNMVNIHVYEDQLEALQEELKREPYIAPKLVINPNIQSLHDVETWVTSDDFNLTDYLYHPPIKYPFTV